MSFIQPTKVYFKKDYYNSTIGCNIKVIPNIFYLLDKREIKGILKEFLNYLKIEYIIDETLIKENVTIIYEKKFWKYFENIILKKRYTFRNTFE